MEKRYTKSITYTWIMLTALFMICFVAGCSNKSYRSVLIDSFEGNGSVVSDSGEDALVVGKRLVAKDVIKTAESAQVQLRVDEDKHIMMSEKSAVSIDAVGDEKKGKVSVNLIYGQTLIEIENKLQKDDSFEVETNNATMAVRGTKFIVLYDENNKTSVEVIEGTVEVKDKKSGKKELLEAGMSATVTDDEFNVSDKPLGLSNNSIGGSNDYGFPILAKVNAIFENMELLVNGKPLWEYTPDELVEVYSSDGNFKSEYTVSENLKMRFVSVLGKGFSRDYFGLLADYSYVTGNIYSGSVRVTDKSGYANPNNRISKYIATNDDFTFVATIDSLKSLGLNTPESICEYFEVTNDENYIKNGFVTKGTYDYPDMRKVLSENNVKTHQSDAGFINIENLGVVDPLLGENQFVCIIEDVIDVNPYIEDITIVIKPEKKDEESGYNIDISLLNHAEYELMKK